MMRIAIVQTNPSFGEVEANLQQALSLMESEQADLYILPELFNSGYNFIDIGEVMSLAEPATSGPTVRRISEFAQQHSCYIVYGFVEKADKLYNSSALVGPQGFIGLYRKIHLYFRENLFFAPGDLGFPVFKLPFGNIGMMICFDWIYPESARSLALQGAELIAHPSNLVLPHCPDAMVTRSLENKIFTATANRVGREKRGDIDLRYIGKSEVVSPRGEILTRLSETESGIASVEVDLTVAREKRINEFNDLFSGRKPQFYIT